MSASGRTLLQRMEILIPLGLVYLAGYVLLRLVEDGLVFHPDRKLTDTPSDYGVAFEDVLVTTSDGVRIHGWWIPAKGTARFSLLFAHGNAGNISDRAENAARLAKMGLHVLLFDYRGYGKSEGSPTEKGIYTDADAMLDHLLARPGVDRTRVLYFGRSLGAAVAIDLASRRAPRGLIAESPFASIRDMAAGIFPYSLWTPVIPRHYDNLTKIASVKCPVMVIHGDKDDIIPFEHGKRVFAAAPEPKRFFDKGGVHNDFYGRDTKAYFDAIEGFLKSLQ